MNFVECTNEKIKTTFSSSLTISEENYLEFIRYYSLD